MRHLSIWIGLLIVGIAHGIAAELYLAPTGRDTHPGTREQPLRTLQAARDAVRALDRAADEEVTVYLDGGTYRVDETVRFDRRDSAKGEGKVIFRALPGQSPVLTGGLTVDGWESDGSRSLIYRARVTREPFRQVYVDGVSAIRARVPNRESVVDRGPYWPSSSVKRPVTRIAAKHWQPCAGLSEAARQQVEMVIVAHWYHQRIRIGEVREQGDHVEILPLNRVGKFNKRPDFYRSNTFYFENALEFVDAPGEWYHDAAEGFLYLAFSKQARPETYEIEVPRLETLIDIRGTPEAPVRGLEFIGLTFQCTNWNQPSAQGVNMTQAAQVIEGDQPPAMLAARHVRGLAVRECTFRNAGAHGLGLFDADRTQIEANRFYQIAANGIDIDTGGGRNPPPDKQSQDIAVWNNRAETCGDHYSNGIFLMANNVRGLVVTHNLIRNMPYSGMQIGQQPGGGYNDVGCGDNKILKNHIHHCNQIHGDGGGIYTLGGIQKGTLIAKNWVHDINQPKGHYSIDYIYLDNRTSKVVARDNVVGEGEAKERNGSRGNTLKNNVRSDPAIERLAGVRPGYRPEQVKSW